MTTQIPIPSLAQIILTHDQVVSLYNILDSYIEYMDGTTISLTAPDGQVNMITVDLEHGEPQRATRFIHIMPDGEQVRK